MDMKFRTNFYFPAQWAYVAVYYQVWARFKLVGLFVLDPPLAKLDLAQTML